ncbi:MAG: carboxypeptidase-like regulatory domain-containing protein [Acidobacteriota bacterium]|nr:carboxypeptidase-like regulatory domain-containing protein [Acidobacteriota bacterium]
MGSSRVYLVLAIWFSGRLLFGQIGLGRPGEQSSSARHPVTGTVVNASTGEPLRRALVTLDGQNAAFTDTAGNFSMDNVPDGRYSVRCQKPGFFAPNEQGGNWANQQVTVSAAAQPVTLKLVPAASIVGRVVDGQGQPIENATVQMSSNIIVNGFRRSMLSNSVNTDEDGNYEIENVQPGTYRLRLNMHEVPPFAAVSTVMRTKMPVEVYPAQYYPEASDASAAQPIVLAAGQTEHADFTRNAVPGFRVRGTVSPVKMGTFIRAENAGGDDMGTGVMADLRTGEWTLPALPSGTWIILAISSDQRGQLMGEQALAVDNGDITNIRLQLLPATTIPVQISNSAGGSPSNVQLRLVGDSGSGQGEYQASYSPPPEPANTGGKTSALSFMNVRAGHYDLRAQVFGTGCLDSVRYAGADAGREGLTVSPNGGTSPVEVVLRQDCATIQVRLNRPARSKSVSVLLLSDNPIFDPRVVNMTGEGPVNLPNLSPGNYRLYAFDDVANLEYGNPDAMRSFTAKELTLDPKQSAEVTLDVTERSADRSTSNGAP